MGSLREWILRWLTTTDHKDIGILYMVTASYFFLVAGVLALLFRVQLTSPDMEFLTGKPYYQAVTVHGLLMLLWFVSPFATGLANYIVPLQIGARDLAFPRLNALSYWLYLASGGLIVASFFVEGGAPDVGWTLYAPLTTKTFTPGQGLDLAALAIALLSASVTLSTINFITTIAVMRAPGVTWRRLSMFTWSILLTNVLMLYAFPPLMVGSILLFLDRTLGTQFFSAEAGGALLWDHLFWFFGHPEVYILLFPALGAIADIVSTFSGRQIYAKNQLIAGFWAATLLSFLVWVHHMFVTGIDADVRKVYSFTTALISIPFEVATLAIIFTMFKGRIRYTVPMLFAIAALFNFIVGGVTGVFLSSIPIDYHLRGSYWVVAHFHYILAGTVVFGLFAATYYWLPKMTGRMPLERPAKAQLLLMVAGLHLLYFPQFLLYNMPRRVYEYDPSLTPLNVLSTIGAFVFSAGLLLGLHVLIWSIRKGPKAPPNPWGASTLEWTIPSPAPRESFHATPVVTDEGRVVYLSDEEIEASGGVDAVKSGRIVRLNGHGSVPHASHSSHGGHAGHATLTPALTGLALFTFLFGIVVNKYVALAGLAMGLAVLGKWISENLSGRFHEPEPKHVERWPFREGKVPLGVWVFVASEVMVFGSLIAAYIFIRSNPVSQAFLGPWKPGYYYHDPGLGALNTVVLFTGAIAFAVAYQAARAGLSRLALFGLMASTYLAVFFLTLKYFEWSHLLASGFTLEYGLPAQVYYALTGAHGLHVAAGVAVNAYLMALMLKKGPRAAVPAMLLAAFYWGMVELVWVLLYPLFYLL